MAISSSIVCPKDKAVPAANTMMAALMRPCSNLKPESDDENHTASWRDNKQQQGGGLWAARGSMGGWVYNVVKVVVVLLSVVSSAK